jgi:RNA polymerase sigma-70 factor (ECF subfamily)
VQQESTIPTPDDNELEKLAARTRRSLIMRLGDWKDQRSWDEFYRTYWRLIYSVALKAGLREDEAWDVVQETVLTIAKQSLRDAYDPVRGSFKMWLWNVTRWRINDQFRQRGKVPAPTSTSEAPDQPTREPVENVPDTSGNNFTEIWEREWQQNVMKAALERVKMRVSPRQFQIFECNVLQGMNATDVRRLLGVSMTQVYLAKHRVGSVLKKEIEYIRAQEK